MEVKLLSKGKDKMSFLVKGIDHAYVNSLRRLIIAQVPTLAIEDVSFSKNNSILYDEVIAHRLGLLPLKTDANMDEKTKIVFSIKAKGPGYVYASELKTTDKKCKPVYPNMPIVKLLDKQELQLEATAMLGIGSEHTKWSPGTAYYVQESTLIINNKHKDFEKFKNKYPPKAFDKKGQLDEKSILQNNLVDACEGVNEEILKVEYNDENFIFNVESWGQMDCKTMVTTALDIFTDKLTELSKLLKAN